MDETSHIRAGCRWSQALSSGCAGLDRVTLCEYSVGDSELKELWRARAVTRAFESDSALRGHDVTVRVSTRTARV